MAPWRIRWHPLAINRTPARLRCSRLVIIPELVKLCLKLPNNFGMEYEWIKCPASASNSSRFLLAFYGTEGTALIAAIGTYDAVICEISSICVPNHVERRFLMHNDEVALHIIIA